MSSHCIRHYEEPFEAHCRTCGRGFCNRCLVYAFGPAKPPFCIGCAITASGVRNGGKVVVKQVEPTPTVDKRAVRAQKRAEKQEARALKRAAKRAPAGDEADEVRTSNVPAPARLTTPASRFTPSSSETLVQ